MWWQQYCLISIATEVADDLRKLILEVYAEHLSPDGYVRNWKVENLCNLCYYWVDFYAVMCVGTKE